MSILKKILLGGLLICALCVGSLFLWSQQLTAEIATDITWGVTFSDSQATYLGLDPDHTFDAVITDLGARRIKLHINWNTLEPTRGVLNFETLDRRVRTAEAHNVELILVIGKKTGRWPECHTPPWFTDLAPEERHDVIVQYVRTIVGRYIDSPAVSSWQLENEPFLEFGTCPDWYYEENQELLTTLTEAVRAIDPTRPLIISESGELSSWTQAAGLADIVGVTLYRNTWNKTEETFGINPYAFLAPEFYATKAALITQVYGKPVISIELQAEPWASRPIMEASLEEQAESMNPDLFRENIAFARLAGLGTYYFWGTEWWYWMKTTHNQPEIWNEAKILFAGSSTSERGGQ
jgi:hypothetical protein